MRKKIVTITLVLVILLGISATPVLATSNLSASPTASTVYVNGSATAFEAYNIGGNNYFKLRDLAYALNGTAKQFEVGYDNATKAITLTTGRAYTPDGGEMARGDGTAKTASPTASRIYLDGSELNLTVYLIGGNNFFKLRDLMEAIDVFVGYDNATKAITLDTSRGYVQEGGAATPTPTPSPSGGDSVSSNALVGSWYYHAGTFWFHFAFGEDGRFAYYVASRSGTNNSINETYVKGKYRASGNNVEFYDNQVDSYFGYGSWKYFGNSQHELTAKELLETPLIDTEKTDNFSMMFEFLDATRLRIILDRDNVRDRYDEVFYRIGTAPTDNVPITPSLPGNAWPKDKLPADVLEYSGGRVREVDTSRSGEVIIMIDNTTREYYISYFNSLIQSGWTDPYPEEFDDFVRDVRSTHWAAGMQKGSYRLSVSWRGDGDVKISYWESRW